MLIINGDDSLANYAYRDKERRHIVLASEALEEDRDKSFYCPYPLCNSKLFLCAVMQIVQSFMIAINLIS